MDRNLKLFMEIYKYACILATAIYFLRFNGFPFADKELLAVLSLCGFIFFLLYFLGEFHERSTNSLHRLIKKIREKL